HAPAPDTFDQSTPAPPPVADAPPANGPRPAAGPADTFSLPSRSVPAAPGCGRAAGQHAPAAQQVPRRLRGAGPELAAPGPLPPWARGSPGASEPGPPGRSPARPCPRWSGPGPAPAR